MPNTHPLSAGQFVQLVLKHEWRIRGFTATMLARGTDIDEVVQNTLLVAWEKLPEFKFAGDSPDEPFVRWVCTIARYQALRHRQKIATSRLVFGDALLEQLTSIQFEEAGHLQLQRDALEGCIGKLSERDQGLIRRRYAGEETIEQLAAWSGRTSSAIYKSLKRIRNSLLRCVEQAIRQEGY